MQKHAVVQLLTNFSTDEIGAQLVLHGESAGETLAHLLPTAGADVPQASAALVHDRRRPERVVVGVERHEAGQSRTQHLRHDLLALRKLLPAQGRV